MNHTAPLFIVFSHFLRWRVTPFIAMNGQK
jgi:hypothetical protein